MREIQDFEQKNDPLKLTRPTELTDKNEKGEILDKTDQYQSLSELSLKKRNAIRRQSIGNTGKMTRLTHHRATIVIRQTTVITYANNVRARAIGQIIQSNYAHV